MKWVTNENREAPWSAFRIVAYIKQAKVDLAPLQKALTKVLHVDPVNQRKLEIPLTYIDIWPHPSSLLINVAGLQNEVYQSI